MNNMNIVHNNLSCFKRGTMVFELPSKKDLTNLFSLHGTCTLIKVGAVRLNNKDQFNKKLGVKLAQEKMSFVGCYLSHVEIRGTKHIYHFKATVSNRVPSEEKTQEINFGVSTVNESDNVQMAYANFESDFYVPRVALP